MFGAKPPPPPPEPDEGVVLMALDADHLTRLALQGQRGPAAELARRSTCNTVKDFLFGILTAEERGRLTGGQFNVLCDAFEAHWAAAHKDTVELPPLKAGNQ
jgi:hypothetical protein